MFHKIFMSSVVFAASAYAADISKIPFKSADGKETSLSAYSGKVVMIVNVASKCGFTKQYTDLQKLYEANKDKGFVILAFPCNNFGGQEPGTIAEIQEFCSTKFNVTFPIMDKVDVKGEKQHPLYAALTAKDGPLPGDVKWNFGKFLLDENGKLLQYFPSKVKPDSDEILKFVK